jgi:hypothetical protein
MEFMGCRWQIQVVCLWLAMIAGCVASAALLLLASYANAQGYVCNQPTVTDPFCLLINATAQQQVGFGFLMKTCNITTPCPAGYMCSPQSVYTNAFYNTGGLNITDPGFQGLCEPCRLGEFCPSGTVNNLHLLEGVAPCPTGAFCTFPNATNTCTQGNICPGGLNVQIPCSIAGTYCPANSSIFEFCAAGFYCPNASVQLQCPQGNFCKGMCVDFDSLILIC